MEESKGLKTGKRWEGKEEHLEKQVGVVELQKENEITQYNEKPVMRGYSPYSS